jgi:hypothetical protein
MSIRTAISRMAAFIRRTHLFHLPALSAGRQAARLLPAVGRLPTRSARPEFVSWSLSDVRRMNGPLARRLASTLRGVEGR